MTHSTRPHHPLSTASALFLVLALTTGWAQAAPPLDRQATSQAAHQLARGTALAADRVAPRALPSRPELAADRSAEAALLTDARAVFQARLVAARAAPPAPPAPEPVKARVVQAAPRVYAGTNHFWVPSLGISRHVYTYSCARDTRLGNYIYRWGCGGANNVYLMGHAASVMKPLHDAYNRGRLRVGMLAMYADGNGRVRTYRVTQWRVVEPADSQWAMASQRVPSMTLQTCVGPSLKYRLVVRLVAVN